MLYQYMKSLGYNDRQIKKIISIYPLCNCREDTLYEKIKNVYGFLEMLEYSSDDIIKITIKFSLIYSFSCDSLKNKMDSLVNFGYSYDDVKKITKRFPSIYSFNIENIKHKIDYLERLGFTHKQILKMTCDYPGIYGCSEDNLKEKMNDMLLLGYSYGDIKTMIINFPQIYGLSIDNIREKKVFYDQLGISGIFINDTKKLMQSVDLSYARYMFLKDMNILVGTNNYMMLFYTQKEFFRRYGVNSLSLLDKYNYEESLINRNIKLK